jgi:hypothetical protein
VFDAGSYPASIPGPKGDYFSVALGVSDLYPGGVGATLPLPDLIVTYEEQ